MSFSFDAPESHLSDLRPSSVGESFNPSAHSPSKPPSSKNHSIPPLILRSDPVHSPLRPCPSSASRFRILVAELSKKHSTELPPPNHSIPERIMSVGIVQNKKKRTYYESFGNDIERYGQEIDDEYFATNMGHAVMG